MSKQTPLNQFISLIAKAEGKKSSVSVGNIREILKIANKELGGLLYKVIDVKFQKDQKFKNAAPYGKDTR